jgi:hypothetical protein
MSDPPEEYTVAETAVLFKCMPSTIKTRCIRGDFDFTVGPDGKWLLTRESILRHLPELYRRHT